ncbi:MAG: SpoIIE family protein phosphatase [Candidatus Eisenbacteria bacterium]|nr:SpoIIE family protein phosphatase [Candidatus Eisenbacteria bacterium]
MRENTIDVEKVAHEDCLFALRFTEELNGAGTFDQLVEIILLNLATALSAERSALFLFNRLNTSLSGFVNRPSHDTAFSNIKLPVEEPFIASLIHSGVPTMGRKEVVEGRLDQRLKDFLKTSLNSSLCVPLLGEEGGFGVICAFDKRAGEEFSNRDLSLAAAMAAPISLALRLSSNKNELRKSVLEWEMLYEVGRAVGSSFDVQAVLNSVLEALHMVLRYEAAGIYLIRSDTMEIRAITTKGYDPGVEEKIKLKVGEGLVGWAVKTGRGLIVPETQNDPRYYQVRSATNSEMVVPLTAGDAVIGAFNVESDKHNAYTEDHLELLTAFANQVGILIERTRLHDELEKRRWIEDELKIARQIQTSFLPSSCPALTDFEVCGTNISYEEVGGDYYDFINIVKHQIGIAIADVSGKGIPASLIMASYRASLRAEIRNNYAIRTILAKVNALLCESVESGAFVTAFYGVLDTKNKVLTFSNAGHYPPILIRKDGRMELLTEGGPVLGVIPGTSYEERPVGLSSGDLLVLYTDGVIDAMNVSREQFGQERLERLLLSSIDAPAEAVMQRIIDEVASFRGAAKQNDDLTLVVLKAR